MTQNKILIALAFTGCTGFLGCTPMVPTELANARRAYQEASAGPAAQLVPAELHKAHEALNQAEQAFSSDPEAYHTRDLAYVAERKSQMAQALAATAGDAASKNKSNSDYQTTQAGIVTKTKNDLNQTRADLASSETSGARTRADLAISERNGQKTAEQLANEQQARADAERRAAAAQEALAKLAAVKQDERGLVITLSGSVLFASDKATLLPEAQTRLDQVSEALKATKDRNAVVEGYTDSRGTDEHNIDLSQRRADAVRSYLVQRGYESSLIQARGLGKDRPIADNATAEGRANNRRVEIIISREGK